MSTRYGGNMKIEQLNFKRGEFFTFQAKRTYRRRDYVITLVQYFDPSFTSHGDKYLNKWLVTIIIDGNVREAFSCDGEYTFDYLLACCEQWIQVYHNEFTRRWYDFIWGF